MTPSGIHASKTYVFHIALDTAYGKTMKLRGTINTIITWVDSKFFGDKGCSDKIDQVRNNPEQCNKETVLF